MLDDFFFFGRIQEPEAQRKGNEREYEGKDRIKSGAEPGRIQRSHAAISPSPKPLSKIREQLWNITAVLNSNACGNGNDFLFCLIVVPPSTQNPAGFYRQVLRKR